MTEEQAQPFVSGAANLSGSRAGFYAAVFTVVVTLVTFTLALTAIPISGANCPADCVDYPYLNTAAQYPKDFLWMIPAMLLVLGFVALMAALHAEAGPRNRGVSQMALSFALIAAVILLTDYYLQFTVVPVSLISAETEGLPLLIQYNPHGVFLALEELGYLIMSLSFFFAGISIAGRDRLASAIRWIFMIGFVLVVLSLAAISLIYGLARLDRFEVLAISVNWLVLIVNGVLLSVRFRRQLRAAQYPPRDRLN